MVMMQQSPQSSLPPGFRFHPTDEELILHYLHKKLSSSPFPVSIIADVNIYKFDPWDLPAKATFGEKEWYFFSPRDRKYPNGARPNRAARSGYWKATGTDKVISVALPGHASQDNIVIGVKKALVFYKGRPPKGIKTNWIMHEYRLSDSPSYIANPNNKPIRPKDFSSMRLDDWVLCRIYKKSHPNSSHQHHHPQSVTTAASVASTTSDPHQEDDEDHRQRYLVSQPSSKSPTITNQTALWPQKSSFFSNSFDATDYSLLSNFLSDPQFIINPPPPLIEVTDSIVTTTTTTMNQQESNNLGYLHHKVLPDHQSTGMMTSTRPKRDRSNGDQDVSMGTYSKKPMTSNFINASGSYDYDDQYGGFVNQAVLNHNLLMSHHLQFQG